MLQKRVVDLEDQNKQLREMFQQRLKFSSDSVLQVCHVFNTASLLLFRVCFCCNSRKLVTGRSLPTLLRVISHPFLRNFRRNFPLTRKANTGQLLG